MRITEKAMAPHSSILAWETPWVEEAGRLQSTGSHRVGHDWGDLAVVAALNFRVQQWELFLVFYSSILIFVSNLQSSCHFPPDSIEEERNKNKISILGKMKWYFLKYRLHFPFISKSKYLLLHFPFTFQNLRKIPFQHQHLISWCDKQILWILFLNFRHNLFKVQPKSL